MPSVVSTPSRATGFQLRKLNATPELACCSSQIFHTRIFLPSPLTDGNIDRTRQPEGRRRSTYSTLQHARDSFHPAPFVIGVGHTPTIRYNT